MVFNGNAGHRFKGLFYLPSRDAIFNGVSSVSSESITLVFNTIILDTLNWKFHSAGRSMIRLARRSASRWRNRTGAPTGPIRRIPFMRQGVRAGPSSFQNWKYRNSELFHEYMSAVRNSTAVSAPKAAVGARD